MGHLNTSHQLPHQLPLWQQINQSCPILVPKHLIICAFKTRLTALFNTHLVIFLHSICQLTTLPNLTLFGHLTGPRYPAWDCSYHQVSKTYLLPLGLDWNTAVLQYLQSFFFFLVQNPHSFSLWFLTRSRVKVFQLQNLLKLCYKVTEGADQSTEVSISLA